MPLFADGPVSTLDRRASEIVLELQRTFGVVVNDEHMGQRVLRSVHSIVDFILSTRLPSAGY